MRNVLTIVLLMAYLSVSAQQYVGLEIGGNVYSWYTKISEIEYEPGLYAGVLFGSKINDRLSIDLTVGYQESNWEQYKPKGFSQTLILNTRIVKGFNIGVGFATMHPFKNPQKDFLFDLDLRRNDVSAALSFMYDFGRFRIALNNRFGLQRMIIGYTRVRSTCIQLKVGYKFINLVN